MLFLNIVNCRFVSGQKPFFRLAIFLIITLIIVACMEPLKLHPISGYRALPVEKQHELFTALSVEKKIRVFKWDVENRHHHDFSLYTLLANSGHEILYYIENDIETLGRQASFELYVWLEVLRIYQENNVIECGQSIFSALLAALQNQKRNVWLENSEFLYSKLEADCKKQPTNKN